LVSGSLLEIIETSNPKRDDPSYAWPTLKGVGVRRLLAVLVPLILSLVPIPVGISAAGATASDPAINGIPGSRLLFPVTTPAILRAASGEFAVWQTYSPTISQINWDIQRLSDGATSFTMNAPSGSAVYADGHFVGVANSETHSYRVYDAATSDLVWDAGAAPTQVRLGGADWVVRQGDDDTPVLHFKDGRSVVLGTSDNGGSPSYSRWFQEGSTLVFGGSVGGVVTVNRDTLAVNVITTTSTFRDHFYWTGDRISRVERDSVSGLYELASTDLEGTQPLSPTVDMTDLRRFRAFGDQLLTDTASTRGVLRSIDLTTGAVGAVVVNLPGEQIDSARETRTLLIRRDGATPTAPQNLAELANGVSERSIGLVKRGISPRTAIAVTDSLVIADSEIINQPVSLERSDLTGTPTPFVSGTIYRPQTSGDTLAFTTYYGYPTTLGWPGGSRTTEGSGVLGYRGQAFVKPLTSSIADPGYVIEDVKTGQVLAQDSAVRSLDTAVDGLTQWVWDPVAKRLSSRSLAQPNTAFVELPLSIGDCDSTTYPSLSVKGHSALLPCTQPHANTPGRDWPVVVDLAHGTNVNYEPQNWWGPVELATADILVVSAYIGPNPVGLINLGVGSKMLKIPEGVGNVDISDGPDPVMVGIDYYGSTGEGRAFTAPIDWSMPAVDTTAPRVRARPMPASTGRVGAQTVTFSYSAVDDRLIASFDVRIRAGKLGTRLGPWESAGSEVTNTRVRSRLGPGDSKCFSVRARDASQNVSMWSTPTCTSVPLDDSALKATGKLRRLTRRPALSGSVTQLRPAKSSGAGRLTLQRSTGSQILVHYLGTRKPTKAAVFVGKRRVGVVRSKGCEVGERCLAIIRVEGFVKSRISIIAVKRRSMIDAVAIVK
jgi:hypothetical protein